MDDAEIKRIESALEFSLPDRYRDFLRHHTDELRQLKQSLPLRAVLWTSADDIISENLCFRRYAAGYRINEAGQPWPSNYLLVGTNGGGDYWFTDRNDSTGAIWFWRHECLEIEPGYENFEKYLVTLRSDAQNPARWQPSPKKTGRTRRRT